MIINYDEIEETKGLEQIQLGGVSKIQFSIDKIREYEALALEQSPEGYYLAFSGGKDSQVIRRLADMAGVKYKAHYHPSPIDPPDVIHFIRQYYPDTIIDRPIVPFWKAFATKGFPLRKKRWCCEYIKEHGGSGRTVLTGVRSGESVGRRRTNMVVLDERGRTRFDKGKTRNVISPILLWTDRDVWAFLEQEKLEYCYLYDEGSSGKYCGDGVFRRLPGCVMCPLASPEQRIMESERFPKIALAWKLAFARLYRDKTALADKFPMGLFEDYVRCPSCGKDDFSNLRELANHIQKAKGESRKEHVEFKDWAVSYLWKTRWPDSDAMFDWWLKPYDKSEKPVDKVENEVQLLMGVK